MRTIPEPEFRARLAEVLTPIAEGGEVTGLALSGLCASEA